MNDGISSRAVLYHYFEVNSTYRDNLIFFFSMGWMEDLDVYLILSSACSFELPKHKNLKIINAPNINLDFGGYCHAVNQYGDDLAKYKSIAFINSSVRGPFLPDYINKSWYDIFLEYLNEETHLVGATCNTLPNNAEFSNYYSSKVGRRGPFPHIQSTAYVMTGKAFMELKAAGFYNFSDRIDKKDVIANYEIGMSDFIINKGWEIKSILYDASFEISESSSLLNFSAKNGDPQYPNSYFGRTFCPEEAIFVKTNRGLLSEKDLASLTFSHLSRLLKRPEEMWSQTRYLLDCSYYNARVYYETAALQKLGIRGKIRRIIQRWLDRN